MNTGVSGGNKRGPEHRPSRDVVESDTDSCGTDPFDAAVDGPAHLDAKRKRQEIEDPACSPSLWATVAEHLNSRNVQNHVATLFPEARCPWCDGEGLLLTPASAALIADELNLGAFAIVCTAGCGCTAAASMGRAAPLLPRQLESGLTNVEILTKIADEWRQQPQCACAPSAHRSVLLRAVGGIADAAAAADFAALGALADDLSDEQLAALAEEHFRAAERESGGAVERFLVIRCCECGDDVVIC